MSDAEDETGDCAQPADSTLIRWRPWPCESCRRDATALGFLVGRIGSSAEIPSVARNEQIDWLKKWEAASLKAWVESCPHGAFTDLCLPRLAEGSEHIVLFDTATTEVVKITRLGLYGDYYEVIDGRISQFDSTPAEYLLRMRWWEKLFSAAPNPIGITDQGQIVSRQQFIRGEPPAQEAVDQFLEEAGAVAVKKSCWLWKKTPPEGQVEIWIGDARADNFVAAAGGIIPVDLRIWGVPIAGGA
jgi:hypothetical protein